MRHSHAERGNDRRETSGLTDQTLPTIQYQFRPTQITAAHLKTEAVQAHNRRDNRQSQTKTALRLATLGAVKPLEHRLTLRLGNPRA